MTGQPHTRRTFLLLIALIALAAAGKAILFDTLDPDCFWHLRVADQLASDGIKPLIDHLTYGSVHARWTPYSWLAELAMKWVWDAAGFRGAVAACAIMSAGLVTLIAATSRSARTPLPPGKDDTATPSYLAATVAVAFAAFLCLPYLSFRPATLAILLLAAVYSLISRERSGTRRGKWIVLLTLILANVHLFAFLVPLWIGAIWAGELAARKPAWRWGILFIATSLASLCTPMLPGALAAVFNYQLNDPMVAGGVIAEMQPFWRGTFGLVSLLMVIAFFVVVIAKRKRFELTDFFLLAISTVALIEKGRFAPLFAIVAAPMLARALPNLSDRALQKPVLPRALAAIVLCGFIRLAAGFPYAGTSMDTWVNRHTPEGPGYPCGAAAFAAARVPQVTGRMINEFTWGGYLGWCLGDKFTPLMDGRTQVFPQEFWQATYLGSDSERSQFVSSLRADVAILPKSKSLFTATLEAKGWQCVYEDQQARVLIPPAALAGLPVE